VAIAAPEPHGKVFGHFAGQLPCADCTGIHLDLTLYSGPATYVLKQTYEGARPGNTSYTEQGTWLIGRGTAHDPKATVYELQATGSHGKQFYLRDGKNTLRALDANRQELPPNLPHTLKRIP
jgi:uncharacterized lipoprotein NlpE involved in copper resistance